MAQKTVITLVDDLTNEEGEDIETYEYGYQGQWYEVDLTEKNGAPLMEVLDQLIPVSRKVTKNPAAARKPKRSGGGRASVDREQNQAIREWAGKNGYTISERGRVPSEVREAYEKAHAQ